MSEGYSVSSDAALLDVDLIHHWLSQESYWATGVPRDVVERSIANSLSFGAYRGRAQVAYARVVTDRATFAWLCDVFVLEEHRGKGLAKRLLDAVMAHPDVQGLRLFLLATRDAHGLYTRYGFAPLAEPARWMVIRRSYVEARR